MANLANFAVAIGNEDTAEHAPVVERVITPFTPFEQLPEIMTPVEAAAWLNVKVSLFYAAARRGDIRVRKYGRTIRVDKAALKSRVKE